MAEWVAQWHAEHVRFSQLLDFLDAQVAELHEGEDPDLGAMCDVVSYLSEFGDRFHHPREDVAFARMVARDPALRLPVNRLLQEHRAIAFAGEQLVALLSEAMAEGVVLRSSIEASAALYLTYYRHHLATEERQIVPMAARLLTPQDWDAVARSNPSGSDPVAAAACNDAYRALRERMATRATTTP
ncbi:hemerythrin domain-containing protein [Variovorax sp. J22P240]|uniref:hemerythrin domain-containing protein n=1 Tax=Variovorax sp. J22P240 TaxID=3053514 RepID=UPI002577446C|nr:hemerythrin domain-containing protein [Variovorax sp. J22P240]MDM0002254.1 hemerythrin domain-containing protein [Variovorax sp. J22P240]